MLPTSTLRGPTVSTSWPPINVPNAPATSIAVRAALPVPSPVPSWVTNHSGTKACRPK